jgi:hypothetical protein
MRLCVLSACYEKPHLASILRESCECQQLPLFFCEAAELGGVWPASGNMRVGKLKAAYEKLLEIRKDYDYALWADGFDTFVISSAARITRQWYLLGYPPMVFSAEKNCWPDEKAATCYPQTKSLYRYINAGTWMGHVGWLIDRIPITIQYQTECNDQRLWTEAFLSGEASGAVIDSDRLIFQTMWGATAEELAEVSPCVVHYNGGIWRNPNDRRYVEHWERVKCGGCK